MGPLRAAWPCFVVEDVHQPVLVLGIVLVCLRVCLGAGACVRVSALCVYV